tara:strand:- start:480 stop:656 length:177 start_codon:yes stop_codon:yes gene_type:complete
MSGVDRAILGEKLKKLGWTENENGRYEPPESLWQNKPKDFSEYDAEEIQDLLGDNVTD